MGQAHAASNFALRNFLPLIQITTRLGGDRRSYIVVIVCYSMEKTTIQISINTLDRLKTLKRFERESYDEVINFVVDDFEDEELTNEEMDAAASCARSRGYNLFSFEYGRDYTRIQKILDAGLQVSSMPDWHFLLLYSAVT